MYQNWLPGQPSDPTHQTSCVIDQRSTNPAGWTAVNCNANYSSVCIKRNCKVCSWLKPYTYILHLDKYDYEPSSDIDSKFILSASKWVGSHLSFARVLLRYWLDFFFCKKCEVFHAEQAGAQMLKHAAKVMKNLLVQLHLFQSGQLSVNFWNGYW